MWDSIEKKTLNIFFMIKIWKRSETVPSAKNVVSLFKDKRMMDMASPIINLHNIQRLTDISRTDAEEKWSYRFSSSVPKNPFHSFLFLPYFTFLPIHILYLIFIYLVFRVFNLSFSDSLFCNLSFSKETSKNNRQLLSHNSFSCFLLVPTCVNLVSLKKSHPLNSSLSCALLLHLSIHNMNWLIPTFASLSFSV